MSYFNITLSFNAQFLLSDICRYWFYRYHQSTPNIISIGRCGSTRMDRFCNWNYLQLRVVAADAAAVDIGCFDRTTHTYQ